MAEPFIMKVITKCISVRWDCSDDSATSFVVLRVHLENYAHFARDCGSVLVFPVLGSGFQTGFYFVWEKGESSSSSCHSLSWSHSVLAALLEPSKPGQFLSISQCPRAALVLAAYQIFSNPRFARSFS